ncbi:GNAT family N-acetyltransferase [Parashewanella curva]|uniref:GNAT family N-acetyltransferase n=1 Tax=Parashewanella curva TaxID=2338552 RepID=A0A3L8PYH0_9GAMM|nr:GNAT family N-acetyltransferase [Parashewanella curva]RLV59869.1 GNAT family N-acetyltransferase [Parashewanella curva]
MQVAYLADHPDEVKTIAQWYFDEWGNGGKSFTYEFIYELGLSRVINKGVLPFSFIILDEGAIVGVAELKYRENKNHPEYEHWVGGVYVEKSHRGKGYSNVLISKAKQFAKELGIKKLYLQCDAHKISLYEKYGFAALHETEHHGDITTVMIWEH